MRNLAIPFLLIALTTVSLAQTPAKNRLINDQKRSLLNEASLVKDLDLKNIGPTVMSGRVTDLAVTQTIQASFMWLMPQAGFGKLPIMDCLFSLYSTRNR